MASVKRVPGPARVPLETALAALDKVEGRVGWFSNAKYPDHGPPVAYVAAIHEHGSPENNIPPRLGMRSTARENQGKWAALSEGLARQVIAGKTTPSGMMDLLGQKGAGDIRKHITGPITPPLKPATVEARLRRYAPGSVGTKVISVTVAHPLTDTKYLLNTLTNTVEPSGGK